MERAAKASEKASSEAQMARQAAEAARTLLDGGSMSMFLVMLLASIVGTFIGGALLLSWAR